jgi:hypothetical protein
MNDGVDFFPISSWLLKPAVLKFHIFLQNTLADIGWFSANLKNPL